MAGAEPRALPVGGALVAEGAWAAGSGTGFFGGFASVQDLGLERFAEGGLVRYGRGVDEAVGEDLSGVGLLSTVESNVLRGNLEGGVVACDVKPVLPDQG